jgi:pimeloyl-ACP methyl ester carboxylesterase
MIKMMFCVLALAAGHAFAREPARMMTIKSKDGTAIACSRSGHGRPLVLVHGTTADHQRWAPILPELEKRFTVYAMDRRGRGASGDAKEYAIEREFDDVAALVDSIGGDVFLLGHSYGAVLSLEASLRTPHVAKLILYEPPVPVAGVAIYPPGALDKLDVILKRGDNEAVVVTFFKELVHMPDTELTALKSLPNWPARVAAARTLPREARAVESYQVEPKKFAALKQPTLLLLGGDSPAFFKAAIEVVHGAISTSKIVVLPGQQHTAMNTAPQLFAREVVSFLDVP